MRPILLDAIGKTIAPTFTEAVSRIFVFNNLDGTPGFVALYTSIKGQATLRALEPIASFTPTRFPRREPYTLTTSSGDTWTFHKGGCGCGNPIKRLAPMQAIRDFDASALSQPAEPVGG